MAATTATATTLFPNKDKLKSVWDFMEQADAFERRNTELKDQIKKLQEELAANEAAQRAHADANVGLVSDIPVSARGWLLGEEDEDEPQEANEETTTDGGAGSGEPKVWVNAGAAGILVKPTTTFYCSCKECVVREQGLTDEEKDKHVATAFGQNAKGEYCTNKHPGAPKAKPAPAPAQVATRKRATKDTKHCKGCDTTLPKTDFRGNGGVNKVKPLCRKCEKAPADQTDGDQN